MRLRRTPKLHSLNYYSSRERCDDYARGMSASRPTIKPVSCHGYTKVYVHCATAY